jgi:hypothetical protein
MASALLDECLDWRLQRSITRHAVRSAKDMRWTGLKDATLLDRAQAEFDALITVDRSLPAQQSIATRPLMIIVLAVGSTRLDDLVPLAARIEAELDDIRPGIVVLISEP